MSKQTFTGSWLLRKILITGATGNVGHAVIDTLQKLPHNYTIMAGVRHTRAANQINFAHCVIIISFNFEDNSTHQNALENCEVLFILRPPQLSDAEKYFAPLIASCVKGQVKHIFFLSVQGVEKSKFIPHHRIEKLIVESKIPYTFLRPAYFMQNFTTTLRKDITAKNRIYLPAGKSKFTLIDVDDIGTVTAIVIINYKKHSNKTYELTSADRLSFLEIASIISANCGRQISYESPNLVRFFIVKRQEKVPVPYVFILIMLHYLPRFQKEPKISSCVSDLTGVLPVTFTQFVSKNK